MAKQTDFIQKIAPIIQREAKARGYKVCSAIIAQAIIESRYGESALAKYHNYFGMKAGSSWKGKIATFKTKEEYIKGILTTVTAKFRAYDSMEDGVKGYFDFINSKRYANLKTATTARQYLEFIKADGYATSFSYVTTTMNAVSLYNLEVWDNFDTTLVEEQKENNCTRVKVTAVGLNIRQGAGVNYKVVMIVKKGDILNIYETIKVGKSTWGRSDKGWLNIGYTTPIK